MITALPIFSLTLKCGIKSISSLIEDFFRKIKKILEQIPLLLTKSVVNKKIKKKENFADNQFHNISRLLDLLPNFTFTKSETMSDYYL